VAGPGDSHARAGICGGGGLGARAGPRSATRRQGRGRPPRDMGHSAAAALDNGKGGAAAGGRVDWTGLRLLHHRARPGSRRDAPWEPVR